MKLPPVKTVVGCILTGIMTLWGHQAAATPCEKPDSSRQRHAVVNLSVNFLREEPDYTSELGTQALMGSTVQIIGEDGYWRQVITSEPYTAWCTALGLVEMTQEEFEDYMTTPKYICTAWKSTVYTLPSKKAGKICDIMEGNVMRQAISSGHRKAGVIRNGSRTEEGSGIRKVTGSGNRQAAAVSGDRISGSKPVKGKPAIKNGFAEVILPDGNTGYVPKEDIMDYTEWTASRKASAAGIISEALKFIGVPYLWGGASPNGVDCSGLVRHVFMMNGIELPRNASQQASSGKAVEMRIDTALTAGIVRSSSGRAGAVGSLTCGSQDTSRNGEGNGGRDGIQTLKQEMLRRIAHLRPGDLLFFGTPGTDVHNKRITHVGIYMGDGKMIHSSQVVRINSLVPGEPDYYENSWRLVRARRILD